MYFNTDDDKNDDDDQISIRTCLSSCLSRVNSIAHAQSGFSLDNS